MSTVPKKGTLLSFHTASRGWVNGVVEDYDIRWYKEQHIITVNLRYPKPDQHVTNSRHLEELGLPLSMREKELINENFELKKKLREFEDEFDE